MQIQRICRPRSFWSSSIMTMLNALDGNDFYFFIFSLKFYFFEFILYIVPILMTWKIFCRILSLDLSTLWPTHQWLLPLTCSVSLELHVMFTRLCTLWSQCHNRLVPYPFSFRGYAHFTCVWRSLPISEAPCQSNLNFVLSAACE